MRTVNHCITFVLAIVLALTFATQRTFAQDPVKVAPQANKVKLENTRVRVLEYMSKPGDKEGMHSHPAVVIYVTSDGKFRSTTPDGKSTEVEYKTGDCVWREAVTHSGENIGTTNLGAILVEMKAPKKK